VKAPTIKSISEAEAQWIQEQMRAGAQFVAEFTNQTGSVDSLADLDAAWAAWMDTSPTDLEDINHAINCTGIPFGSLLVGTGQFSWCIASDEWGTDLAVRALPDRGDVLVYPADFVSKRWESRTTDFLADAFPQILEHVAKTKQDWDDSSSTQP
jgi:hypothetical protein